MTWQHGSDQRSEAMAAAFREGRTMKQIGAAHGVTRQRVQQILRTRFGLAKMDGGAYRKSLERPLPTFNWAASDRTFVYFAKPVDFDGPIKIGCSRTPDQRLLSLAAWSPFPLEIVAMVPGTLRLEANIHECLAPYHSHKEWFFPEEPVLDLIERLRAGAAIHEAIDLSKRLGSIRRKRGRRTVTPGAVTADDFLPPLGTEAAE